MEKTANAVWFSVSETVWAQNHRGSTLDKNLFFPFYCKDGVGGVCLEIQSNCWILSKVSPLWIIKLRNVSKICVLTLNVHVQRLGKTNLLRIYTFLNLSAN